MNRKDLFISHSSDDKKNVVLPLVDQLIKENITYWVDEAEINWGESITKKINEGLQLSRYVIVIVSESFILKKWTNKELEAAFSAETTEGTIKVLPIIVGGKNVEKKFKYTYPLMQDKLFVRWEEGPEKIATKIKSILKNDCPPNPSNSTLISNEIISKISKRWKPDLRMISVMIVLLLFGTILWQNTFSLNNLIQKLENSSNELDRKSRDARLEVNKERYNAENYDSPKRDENTPEYTSWYNEAIKAKGKVLLAIENLKNHLKTLNTNDKKQIFGHLDAMFSAGNEFENIVKNDIQDDLFFIQSSAEVYVAYLDQKIDKQIRDAGLLRQAKRIDELEDIIDSTADIAIERASADTFSFFYK